MVSMTNTVYVRSGRHPIVLGLLVGLWVIALYSLVYDPPSRNLDLAFDYPQRAVWSAQVLVASSTTLAGLAVRDRLSGLLIERVGLGMLVVGLGTYLYILVTVSSWHAAGIIIGVVAGAIGGAVARVVQIHNELRAVRGVQAVLDA